MNELLIGVGIALGNSPIETCDAFDRQGDGRVAITDLLAGVQAALNGCPSRTPTLHPTSTWSPSATSTPNPSPSPSPSPNLPPTIEIPALYRGLVGEEIDVPILAVDPEGASVSCDTKALPAGASFTPPEHTENRGALRWTPGQNQIGVFYVDVACSDGDPIDGTAERTLAIQVQPRHACLSLDCQPASGCTSTLAALDDSCCVAESSPRIAEPKAPCPEGRAVFIGRNTEGGFGRLHNCDYLRVVNFGQARAEIQLNLETRCLNTSARIATHIRMETTHRLAVDASVSRGASFTARDDGFYEVRALRLPLNPPLPFFDLDNAEANITVTLTDVDGNTASQTVRVVTTFDPLPGLPDP